MSQSDLISQKSYDNFDSAVTVRKAAEVEHGFHPNHGKLLEEKIHDTPSIIMDT